MRTKERTRKTRNSRNTRNFTALILACSVYFASFAFSLFIDADAQKPRTAAPSKFSKFKHSSHDKNVKSLIGRIQPFDLDCAYCHGTAVKDKIAKDEHDIEVSGYPSHKNGMMGGITHSACTDCHAFTGSRIEREMCVICHDKLTFNQQQMATNIRRFPNPGGGGVSQFYDFYSHSEHVDFFEQYATMTPLKERVKFYDAKKDAKANKGLDKNKYECAACHVMNHTQVTVSKIDFAPGLKMSSPGHPECYICHLDPKIVTPPKKDKPDPKNSFATNCTGCHQSAGKPIKDGRPVKGSEPAPLWFVRQIINTELNPIKPGIESPLPYSHKTHIEAVGKAVPDCLSCHVTGKSANTRSDFYLEDRKTKERQPLVWSCIDCHKKEMQTKIEGAVTIESAKCNYCHALQTIRGFGAIGIQLPPPNHFFKKPAATPTPTPTPTPAPPPTPAAKP